MNFGDWHDRFIPEPMSGCFLWEGATQRGYGAINRTVNGERKLYRVHRLVLEEKLGRPLLPGMLALHTCDVKLCGNEHHLYEGTDSQNMYDTWARSGRSHDMPWFDNRGSKQGRSVLKESDIPEIKRRLLAGERQHVIANDYGVTRAAINNVAHGYAWGHLSTPYDDLPRKRGSAILTVEKVKEIKELLKSERTQQSIADKFHVSRGAIQSIKEGKNWKDV